MFCGALSALGLMTFLSVCLGFATLVIPRSVTFYACTVLLALFGVKMLYEGYNMSPEEGQEELEEVTEELRKREETVSFIIIIIIPSPKEANCRLIYVHKPHNCGFTG